MPNDRTQVIVPENILPTSFLPKPPTVHSGHTLLRDVSKTHLVILTYDPERSNTGSDRYTPLPTTPRRELAKETVIIISSPVRELDYTLSILYILFVNRVRKA